MGPRGGRVTGRGIRPASPTLGACAFRATAGWPARQLRGGRVTAGHESYPSRRRTLAAVPLLGPSHSAPFEPTTASLPKPIPAATAANVPKGLFFDANREHLGCRESWSPHYEAQRRREAVLIPGVSSALILMDDVVKLR